jgi:hypothetical protein
LGSCDHGFGWTKASESRQFDCFSIDFEFDRFYIVLAILNRRRDRHAGSMDCGAPFLHRRL